MPQRDDIAVDWFVSPRLITVAAPSVAVTVQDLLDTLRELEARPSTMIHQSIVAAAGKEPLGGGVFVGVTLTLLNARLAFESRKAATASGTASAASSDGSSLEDGTAAFVTDGVEPGAWVINLDDLSTSTVLEVLGETSMRLEPLGGGSSDTWTIGDAYRLQTVISCDVDGGNLVAFEDDGVTELNPVFPTTGTQVNYAKSSSATLIDGTGGLSAAQATLLEELHISMRGKIVVDPTTGVMTVSRADDTDAAQYQLSDENDVPSVIRSLKRIPL